jgi:hypothetical protein
MSMPSSPGSSSSREGESRRLEPNFSGQEADKRAHCSSSSASSIGRRTKGKRHACADMCALARGGLRFQRPMLPFVRGWSPPAFWPLVARWPASASASGEVEAQWMQLRFGLLLCLSCWWGGWVVVIIARWPPMAAWPLCQVACAWGQGGQEPAGLHQLPPPESADRLHSQRDHGDVWSMTSGSCRYGSDVSRHRFNIEVWPY